MNINKLPVLLVLSIFFISCSSTKQAAVAETKPVTTGPSAMREFRAAWVATVANINWPSKPGLPVAQQKEEALKLLDYLADNNFNAVILH